MLKWLKSLAFKQQCRDTRIAKKKVVTTNAGLDSVSRKSARQFEHPLDQHQSGQHQSKKHAKYLSHATIVPRGEHGISRKRIDKHALKVLYRLHQAGFQACLVGGAVRDLLIGEIPKDFDVATDATPEQVAALFRNCRLIGRRFRLAHVYFGRQTIEVATYRADHGRSDSGCLDETGRIVRDNVYGNISDDVWRRDFTANALYYDISNFSVIDFVGGLSHVKQRHLQMIGDADKRYHEDPVRMLRAIRFAAKLDFTIEENSRLPIYKLAPLLQDIPAARLYEEVLKMFHSGHALKSFNALNEFNILHYLFPATALAIKEDPQIMPLLQSAMTSTDERIKNNQHVTPAFLFAALLWVPVSKRAQEISAKGLPYSVAIQKAATAVMRQQVKSISIPRRFTSTMRDIWGLQTRFHYRKGRRVMAVLEHPKFRAAYDFLCLRARSGEEVEADCEWWTNLQQLSVEQQNKILKQPGRSKKTGSKKAGSNKIDGKKISVSKQNTAVDKSAQAGKPRKPRSKHKPSTQL